MSEWKVQNEIIYAPDGDDLDTFALKTKAEFGVIYTLMNRLRRLDAAAGDISDSEPYQLHVDSTARRLYMRSDDNSRWIELGRLGESFFGITPGDIGAVENGGEITTIYGGLGVNKPTSGINTNALYYAFDEKRLYYWSGTAWEIMLSLNFADLSDYASYCLTRDEAAYSGAGKVLRLDAVTGKGNIDISGSAEKILGKKLDVTELRDGDVLVYDAGRDKFINQAKDELTRDDVSQTGEANKIVETDGTGVAHISINGSAACIDGVKVDTGGIKDGQVLAYNASQSKLSPTETAKLDIEGSASKIDGVSVSTIGLRDGRVLAYSASNKRLQSAEMISASIDGSAKMLEGVGLDAINLDSGTLLEYDGRTKKIITATKRYISENDVSASGDAEKIVRVDREGLIHADLDGSASKINGVGLGMLQNGELLTYNSRLQQIVSTTNTYLTTADVSETSEAGKLVRVPVDKTLDVNIRGTAGGLNGIKSELGNIGDGQLLSYNEQRDRIVAIDNEFVRQSDYEASTASNVTINADGRIEVDTTGSAAKVDGVRVDTTGMKDGQVLIYNAALNKLIPADKDYITEDDISESGEIGKLLRIAKDKDIPIDISGSANAIDHVNVVCSDIEDGDVLVYHAATKSFVTEPKSATSGEGKFLVFRRGRELLLEYNGSQTVDLDVDELIGAKAQRLAKPIKLKVIGMAHGETEFDGSKDIKLKLYDVNAVLAAVAGVARKASRLSTARKIEITGDGMGSVMFDGSSDVTLTLTLNTEQLVESLSDSQLSETYVTKAELDERTQVSDEDIAALFAGDEGDE